MKFLACVVLSLATVVAEQSEAQERVTLGWGRLFSNDAFGDGQDRWHTGAYSVSKVVGDYWNGDLPSLPDAVWEYRFGADTYAPANLESPAADDRRYAGALTFGAITHFDHKGYDSQLGGGFTFIGPSTGLGAFQKQIHELLGMDIPTTVLDDQIQDQVQPFVRGEIARALSLGAKVALRPFAAAQIGAEDLLRVGGDLIIGNLGKTDLLLRDTATGHLYRGIAGDVTPQFSFLLGADYAQVFNSVYLPRGEAAVLTPHRERLRMGTLWQGRGVYVFSGLTYLSPEFDSQPEGQVLGSLTLSISF